MKIFHKRFVRLIHLSKNLDELIYNLQPWIEEVNKPDSPFMIQTSTYFLRRQGSSLAPRFFKKVVASELYRLTGKEDMKATILLGLIEAYRTFLYGKGSNISNWLSWKIPYIVSKYIQPIQVKYIEPTNEFYEEDYSLIDDKKNFLDIITNNTEISNSQKKYYLSKGKVNATK